MKLIAAGSTAFLTALAIAFLISYVLRPCYVPTSGEDRLCLVETYESPIPCGCMDQE